MLKVIREFTRLLLCSLTLVKETLAFFQANQVQK